MPDNSPGSKDRKLTLVAPAIIAGVVVMVVLGAFLAQRPRNLAVAPAPPPQPPAPAATVLPPSTPPPLGRKDLISAAAAVSDRFVAGGRAEEPADPLVGRRFQVRIAFGCQGLRGRPAGAQAFAEYDPERRTVRLAARPGDWTTLPLVQALPGADGIEAVEGFWIPRPWTTDDACPAPADLADPATPTPPAAQTLGLAQVFTPEGSRLMRRGGRPYEHVRKAPDDEPAILSHDYRLVLEGRIVGFPSGRAIECWSESPDHRPVCLYGVEFDRVAFEDSDSGAMLAEWRG